VSILDVELFEVVQNTLSLDKYLQKLKQEKFSYSTIIRQGTKVVKLESETCSYY